MNTIHLTRQHSLYNMFSERSIQARQGEIARLNEQLGTMKSVNRASDDPSAYSQARRMEVLGERYDQYQRSIESARSWSYGTQSALDNLSDLFTNARESGLRAANGSFLSTDAETMATELESLLSNVVDTLNTKSGDEYLFAGSRTTVQPFELNSGAGTVDYAGNANSRKRTIGHDVTMDINISGDRIYQTPGGLDITSGIQGLIEAVRSGDADGITAALADVETAQNHVISLAAESGIIGDRLNAAEEQLADAMLLVEGRRSELEDADMAEVMMQFQREQTGLQAALQSASAILQTSILDYLR